MKTAYLTAGAAGMYCGSCMRDNTLVAALRSEGVDSLLVPMYTPIRTDFNNVSEERVFYGGINVFLSQRFSWWSRLPDAFRRALSAPSFLRAISRMAIKNRPDGLGELTLSVLRGENGRQAGELDELCGWLENDIKPDLVHLTNSLFIGLAGPIRRRLGVPVVCTLQGEDLFLDGLPAGERDQALTLIREASDDVDLFVTVSNYYREFMAGYVGLDADRIRVVRPGISTGRYRAETDAAAEVSGVRTIGYFARICEEKGVGLLLDSFSRLKAMSDTDNVRLRIAGYLSPADQPFVERALASLDERTRGSVELVGEVEFTEKCRFLAACDLLCVPTLYREPQGLYVLEALTFGVPVVVPDHGVFPELVDATGGGRTVKPRSAEDLAQVLHALVHDRATLEKLGRRGQRAVDEIFTDVRMARETARIYEEVLQAGQTRT
jgi:glycosyltransferase involved in cell wall biosynthesis